MHASSTSRATSHFRLPQKGDDSSGQLRVDQRPSDGVSDFQGHVRTVPWTPFHRPDRDPRLLDHVGKDLGSALDNLQTRTDIDASKIAYMGHSMGAEIGRCSWRRSRALASGPAIRRAQPFLRQAAGDQCAINFLPRVRIPVLMVNGAYHSILPVATSQEPMFQRLGTSPAQKRHVVFKSGHAVTVPEVRNDLVREVLAWLDTCFGKT